MDRFALITTLALSAATASFAQTPPPASAFGRLPAIQDADISPDGQRIIMLGGPPEQRMVTIATVDSPVTKSLGLGDIESEGVQWATDQYAIVNISLWDDTNPKVHYHLDRAVVVDTDARAVSRLLQGTRAEWSTGHNVLRVIEGDKPEAIVLATDFNSRMNKNVDTHIMAGNQELVWALWRVDLKTGHGIVQERGTPESYAWTVDRSGQARLRWDNDEALHIDRLLVRAKGTNGWKPLLESPEDQSPDVLGYSDPDDAAFIRRTGPDGATEIVRHSLTDGSDQVVASVKGGGAAMLWDRYLDKPAAIVKGTGAEEYEWRDPDLQAAYTLMAKAFHGKTVAIESWSRDHGHYLVQVSAPDSPPAWYLYDKTRHEVSPVGEAYPELQGAALGKATQISYKARDGLTIPAYLTLPPGAPANGAKLPLIVFPHGGPASHDDFEFDWWTQYMATRGYAVLQPQFRGSTGYGADFENAGRKEWGGKMQTDLLDGVAYLASQGVVDPTRVCIVGASFGGYAALAGATLHPTDYRCAVSVNGVSDLPSMIGETLRQEGADSGGLRYWKRVMGDPSMDKSVLVATSPVRQITPGTPPILIVVSDQDTTVNPVQSSRMRDALQAAHRPYQYVTLEKDDHYLMKSATRTRMLEAVGDFLAANLPVGR